MSALFGGDEPSEPEAPIDGLPPRDKPIADYTEEERAAMSASFERKMRERGERERQERQEAEERQRAEDALTPSQRLGYAIRESALPGAKDARNAALIRSIHGGPE